MEKTTTFTPNTLNRLKVIGLGAFMCSVAAPVVINVEAKPVAASLEQAYIPEEIDYLPDKTSKALK
jgi:hypothetical protein